MSLVTAADSSAFDRFDVLPLLAALLGDADAIARVPHNALRGYITAAVAARRVLQHNNALRCNIVLCVAT